MTKTSSREGRASGAPHAAQDEHVEQVKRVEGDDHADYPFAYGHGRMPFFMKLVWLGFLTFAAWYTITHLLAAVADETG